MAVRNSSTHVLILACVLDNVTYRFDGPLLTPGMMVASSSRASRSPSFGDYRNFPKITLTHVAFPTRGEPDSEKVFPSKQFPAVFFILISDSEKIFLSTLKPFIRKKITNNKRLTLRDLFRKILCDKFN